MVTEERKKAGPSQLGRMGTESNAARAVRQQFVIIRVLVDLSDLTVSWSFLNGLWIEGFFFSSDLFSATDWNSPSATQLQALFSAECCNVLCFSDLRVTIDFMLHKLFSSRCRHRWRRREEEGTKERREEEQEQQKRQEN